MKINLLVICALCFTPSVFAQTGQQQQKRFGDSTCLPAYLSLYDVNNDGMIEEKERQAMELARDQIRNKLRIDWDADGDGKISDQERDQAKLQLCDIITESRTTRFLAADTDGVEGLSYDEFILLPGMAKKLVDKPEVVLAIFDRLDADDNGTISLDEFLACVKQCDQARDGTGTGTGICK
jgi:Ca2+-binding EF-hand superfamily protein